MMMCKTYGSSSKTRTSAMMDPEIYPEEPQHTPLAHNDQLQRENERVVEQLKEVTKMNTHWQRYDSQREEYVVKQTRTNQDLQNKVSDLQRQVEEISIANKTDAVKQKQKPKSEGASHRNENEEVCDTRPQDIKATESSQKEEEILALTGHITKLKDKILELEKGRESRKKEDDDQLAILREQVNVCVEDFKQERRDRERIHTDNEKLRERLTKAEQDIIRKNEQLYLYQQQVAGFEERLQLRPDPGSKAPHRNGYDEPCCYPEDRNHRHRVPVETRKKYWHPMHLGDNFTDLPAGDVVVDSISNDPKAFD